MGYIYGFRHGTEDLFKIGQTTATPAKRRSTLQTNCAHPLSLFDAIETDEYSALEKYIKDTWADRRSVDGGSEIYSLTEDEAADLFAHCRIWVTEELPKQRRIEQLETVEPDPDLRACDAAAKQLRTQWIKLRDEEERIQQEYRRAVEARQKIEAELKLRDEEVRIQQEYEEAVAARERIETEIKLAIGTSAGIEGIATWDRVVKSRRISAALVEANEPELFAQCVVPSLSSDKLRALLKSLGRAKDYETFQEIKHTRRLTIAE